MKRARVYDVRNGDTDYRNMLSRNKDAIFWDEAILKNAQEGDVVFFVNREEKEVLYTVATDVVCTGVRSQHTWLKEFTYGDGLYASREGDEFRKYAVLQWEAIPRGWKWTKPLRHNGIADVWIPGEADNAYRLARMNDLGQLFDQGPARDMLEQCNPHLKGINLTVNQTKIEMALVTQPKTMSGSKRLKRAKDEFPSYGITFDHPYRQLLMSVRTKPFVLLSGVSGTGKSWLVRKLAYITCTDSALRNEDYPGNIQIIRVRPDWHEPDDLLGYAMIRADMSRYHCTDLLRFIVKASQYPHVPFFVCLDEMNLARIEHYFSDFLSILETGRRKDGEIVYDAFISKESVAIYSREDPEFWAKLGIEGNPKMQAYFLSRGIMLPANLTVIGTINMDETTHILSKRVLDRTIVIEMQGMDIEHGLTSPVETWEYPDTYEAAAVLMEGKLSGREAYNNSPKVGTQIMNELKKLNGILIDSPFAISYRVREDILLYCAYNEALAAYGTMPANWLNICLDEIICMKILTRISGDDTECGDIIEKLLAATRQYPNCQRKLSRIQLQLRKTGLTSFW
ncbi:McrB family protein [Chitinophaga sp. S165]|uniref:McrB family protein n=1 Tax=Chitinophaga sp. S165 TaxID=2135462 RepID=UPI000D7150A5|nr:AAA family ATPase [Chitinophaga sp. S165]PWV44850.1 dynein-related subfamily AAA family protein [Chitinophaga sp. S165]